MEWNSHLKSKLHDEISISLYKSSSHGEEMLFDHPLLVGLMQWNGVLLDHENPRKPNDDLDKIGLHGDMTWWIEFMDDVQSARYGSVPASKWMLRKSDVFGLGLPSVTIFFCMT